MSATQETPDLSDPYQTFGYFDPFQAKRILKRFAGRVLGDCNERWNAGALDENLAHTAVVEGQASWLMIAYELKRAGQPAEPTPAALKSITDSSDAGMDDFPVLKNSPLYIQQSLLFPYTQGTEFFQSVWKKMGKRAFAEVFTQPPVDTAQVIHPDRYFARVMPQIFVEVLRPALALAEDDALPRPFPQHDPQ